MFNPGQSNLARLHSLGHIYKNLHTNLETNQIKEDLVSGQIIINAWPHVVATYELMEIALKGLIHVLNPNYKAEQMKRDGHNLCNMMRQFKDLEFGRLAVQRIEEGFDVYISLHSTFPYRSLEEFISAIANDYTLWRYYPLEGWADKPPAVTSPFAMLEIIFHIRGVMAKHVATDHGLASVTDRLEISLARCFRKHLDQYCGEVNITNKLLIRLANDWISSHSNTVTAIARYVFDVHKKDATSGEIDLDPVLVRIIESTIVDIKNADVRRFSFVGAHNVRAFYDRMIYDEKPVCLDTRGRFINS